jgi:hypothetical protein
MLPLHGYDHVESLLTIPSRIQQGDEYRHCLSYHSSRIRRPPRVPFGRQKSAPVFSITANEATPPTICLKVILFRQSKARNPSFGSILERDITGER